jgi:translation initiation factor IF-2
VSTKLRVYEVAEELGVESSQLIQMLREMDVPVRSHMSSVEPDQIARLHARLERDRRTELATGTSRVATTRRRRRRRQPKAIGEAAATEEVAVEAPVEVVELAEIELEAPSEDLAAISEEELVAEEAEVPEETLAAELEGPAVGEVVPSEEIEGAEEAPAPEAEIEPEVEAPLTEEHLVEAELAVEREEREPFGETRPTRKPKPARRDMPAVPTASAAPGGTVRIQAEGYTVDGRRTSRRQRRKRRSVDQEAVKESVKKTLASIEATPHRKRRRDVSAHEEAERELRELEEEAETQTVRVNEFLTVAELADLIDVSPQQVITFAFKNLGLMVTINQRLDFDQIELICEAAGYTAIREEGYEADLAEIAELEDSEAELVARAPVVTVMGHVDHGKTSLLDLIRKTNVIAGEAGGITQHIGAYAVMLDADRTITFLDTPGHEAFTAMRARGAEVTDLVILVVAADDAVMPQTVEAISHARNAGVPMVVAINKVDLPSANVDRVKQELLAEEVVLEEFGGEVLATPVSAKTGDGIDELLEKVLLQAEVLELEAVREGPAQGTVVEAELDRGLGPVATVLVQRGTLAVGDDFVCGLQGGRVRALLDERGNSVPQAGPSTPVRVIGLEGVPQAGDALVELSAERVREITGRRQQLEREKELRRRAPGTRLEDIFERIQAGEQARLNLVIKGDTDGSVQALQDSLERLSTDEVAVEVIHRAVGGITESDVLLATTSEALIIGFHVRPDVKAQEVADREGVEIRIYNVIYEAVEDIRLALEGLLEPEEREITVGTAEIRELFRVPKVGTVAGCYVSAGTMRRNLPVHLLRDQVQIYDGKIFSLKRFKDDVREVREGYECGLAIEGYNDIKVGDVIECYEVQEFARTLSGESAS